MHNLVYDWMWLKLNWENVTPEIFDLDNIFIIFLSDFRKGKREGNWVETRLEWNEHWFFKMANVMFNDASPN